MSALWCLDKDPEVKGTDILTLSLGDRLGTTVRLMVERTWTNTEWKFEEENWLTSCAANPPTKNT